MQKKPSMKKPSAAPELPKESAAQRKRYEEDRRIALQLTAGDEELVNFALNLKQQKKTNNWRNIPKRPKV